MGPCCHLPGYRFFEPQPFSKLPDHLSRGANIKETYLVAVAVASPEFAPGIPHSPDEVRRHQEWRTTPQEIRRLRLRFGLSQDTSHAFEDIL